MAQRNAAKNRRWVFTLNNYTDDDEQRILDFFEGERVTYGIFGRERGENGTPHLQGFVIFRTPQRLSFCRANISDRAHYEQARGTSEEASEYCKKDANFDERGTCPAGAGARTDLDQFREWVTSLAVAPSQREIAQQFPSLWLRYPRLVELAGHLLPQPVLIAEPQPKQWQQDLDNALCGEPDDRSIFFFVDPEGGKGKSWFVRWQMSKKPDETQFLSVGKRDDLAYAIDETKRVFLFDLPRGSLEHFQYSVLEKLKDQLVFSSKYASRVKVLPNPVHVVVFCNEQPDMNAMTADRYNMCEFADY
nr:MAG: replication-associated protein [clictolig virus 3]